MFKKKIILSLGAITAIAPLFVAVSCGINKYPTSEEQKLYTELTSNTALRILENQWQEKVLAEGKGKKTYKLVKEYTITGGIKVMAPNLTEKIVEDIAVGMIQNKINGNNNFLVDQANNLMNSGVEKLGEDIPGMDPSQKTEKVYEQTWLQQNGLLSNIQYPHNWKYEPKGTAVHDPNALTYAGLQLLVSDDRLTFKTELLNKLMVFVYLDNVSKNQWSKVNTNENTRLASYEQTIDPTVFPLVKEMIDKKYFGKWEIALNKDDSGLFDIKKDQTIVTPQIALDNISIAKKGSAPTGTNYLVDKINYSQTKTLSSNKIYDFNKDSGINFDTVKPAVFKGIISQSAELDILRFNEDTLQSATTQIDYQGFLIDEKVQGTKKFVKFDSAETEKTVPLFKDKSETAAITLISGIMPIWDKTKSMLTFKDDATKLRIQKFLAIFDQDLYSEAKRYFLTEVGKKEDSDYKAPILLELEDTPPVKEYQEILEDMGVDYFEAKDPA